jgi:glycerol uptake facilitator-like aquaporin
VFIVFPIVGAMLAGLAYKTLLDGTIESRTTS